MKILKKTQSICPECKTPLDAFYIEKSGKVYFEKTCSRCGNFSTLAADKVEDYLSWVDHPVVNVAPKKAMTKGSDKDRCPLHCGTCENHLQTACCIILDVTKRCNQHCPYCFARADENDTSGYEPTLEELAEKYDLLLELGEERPFNIQLSGGEPTVRDDLPQIIEMAKEKGFEYIQINSNGKRLALEDGYAKKLKKAGASVIFMQFDGTREDIYLKLRGEPLLALKKKAIENCRKAGLPVTIVPTIVEGVNLDNIGEMLDFLINNIAVVKGIHFQPVSYFGRCPEKLSGSQEDSGFTYPDRVTMFRVLHEIEKQHPKFKYTDFCPINTGHTLCCFYSTYLKEGPDQIKCMVSDKTKSQGVSCCDTSSCCGAEDPEALDIIKKDRDFVLNKWDMPEEPEEEVAFDPLACFAAEPETQAEPCCCDPKEQTNAKGCCDSKEQTQSGSCCEIDKNEPMDMDEFLRYYKSNIFTVTGMAFQDMSNLDAERLKRCRVQVMTKDNKLVPFCGYTGLSEIYE